MDKWIKTVEQLLAANNGVDMKHASTSELYRAVSRATMAEIADTWQKCKEAPQKRVGYLSAEFLVGRAIFCKPLQPRQARRGKSADAGARNRYHFF